MWPTRRRAPGPEALLGKLRARSWKNDAERDELLKATAAAPEVEAGDVAWLAVDTDVALRSAGLSLLKKFPYETSSAAIFSFLAAKAEPVRRQAMQTLETLAGGNFFDRLQTFLANPDPVVVHAALDYLRKNPNERALPWIAKTMTSEAAAPVRRKAFAIAEDGSWVERAAGSDPARGRAATLSGRRAPSTVIPFSSRTSRTATTSQPGQPAAATSAMSSVAIANGRTGRPSMR